jgi:ribonuclease I
MRGIHAVRVATAVLGVLAVVSAGEARQHKPPQSHAGDFDFYLLSMSIDPSFCALSPANRSKPDCRDLTAETFRQTPLTIHGLWPNRAHVSVNQQPAQCTRDALRLSDAVRRTSRATCRAGPIWNNTNGPSTARVPACRPTSISPPPSAWHGR